MLNKRFVLQNRPVGVPTPDVWQLQEVDVLEPGEGEILIQQHFISLDPAMRGWMDDRKSYLPPIGIGEVMRAVSVGQIVQSRHPTLKKGDFVAGAGGVQQFVCSNGKGWIKVDPTYVPLSAYAGILGITGLTAYFGLLDVGALQAGDRVLISGAAGAVGSVAGQIAKIKDCEVTGIAGGSEKCKFITEELGFDHAIDYKNENIYKRLSETCPKGIDVYFDNVGGEILDASLTKLRRKARVVICGAISQYNRRSKMYGPANYLSILVNRARMEGFIVMDYQDQYPQAIKEMAQWMAAGKLKYKETVVEGIENFYDTFLRLFDGNKLGKLVLKVV